MPRKSIREMTQRERKRHSLEALNAEPDAAPEKLLANVRGAVRGFVRDAEQFDDITMLCLEYNGKI